MSDVPSVRPTAAFPTIYPPLVEALTTPKMQAGAAPRADGEAGLPTGLAHVATASFLASRAAPTAGFWIALAGGVALARAGERRGLRVGYGASVAAMLQTVAVMGPARFGVPFTQALTAPLLGDLEARGRTAVRQVLACALIRIVQNAAFVALFALVLAGGLDAYTDTYDAIARRLPLLPEGTTAALIATGVGLLLWAAFASTVQVLIYRRGLHRWPATPAKRPGRTSPEPPDRARRRFDPRAVAIAAAISFGVLLASTSWVVLAATAGWLALAWVGARGDSDVVPAGVAIAAVLALGIFGFALVGGAGAQLALRRATRAGLLVLVATWLRSAAGAAGLREVSRRALGRLERLPSMREAALLLEELGSGRQLGRAGRSVLETLRPVPKRPLPVLDAVLEWVAAESERFRAARAGPPSGLSARAVDAALVSLAAGPMLVLVAL